MSSLQIHSATVKRKVPSRASMTDIEDLRKQWILLYANTLPQLARSSDPVQPQWPVSLDHCFARIILDNIVGKGQQQWDCVIKKPAIKHMSLSQLRDAIDLGEKIWTGEADLTELDRISLTCRGKQNRKYGNVKKEKMFPAESEETTLDPTRKRKPSDQLADEHSRSSTPKSNKRQATLSFETKSHSTDTDVIPRHLKAQTSAMISEVQISTFHRIQQHNALTPYRKRLYTILLSVPRGRFTTYAVMSDYLGSSARAVGNGMRRNPLAPDVPCHRVLAADKSLGGFCGDWGKEGKYASKKIELLRGEGIRFDVKGKAVGEPFRQFHEFEAVG